MSDELKDFGPTPTDILHGLMYALNRIKKDKCMELINNKPDKYSDLIWKESPEKRQYPITSGLKDAEYGNCMINSRKLCMENSILPYINDPSAKNYGDTDFPVTKCDTDEDCKDLVYTNMNGNQIKGGKCLPTGDNTEKKCLPKLSYYEWRDNKCILGNFMLKKWCEIPSSRDNKTVKGMTDTPPFKYDDKTGKCNITKEYCDWEGVDFKEKNKNGRPDCHDTGGFLEDWILGKTLFRSMKNSFKCHKEKFTLIDDSKKSTERLIAKDFAGKDINIYAISWDYDVSDYVDITKPIVGYNCSEIEKKYPELIVKKDGLKFIKITLDDVKKRPELKRIFFVCNAGTTLFDLLNKQINN